MLEGTSVHSTDKWTWAISSKVPMVKTVHASSLFSHEVDAKAGYTLPLRGLPAIDELTVDAMIADGSSGRAVDRKQHLDAKKSVATKDFHVSSIGTMQALRHGKTIVARLRPDLSVAAEHRGRSGLRVLR